MNEWGILGDGTTSGGLTPVQVTGGGNWESINAGWRHSCGIKDGGRLFTWGKTSFT